MGVTTKEEAILRAQELELIYAQFGILYEIIPEAPRSSHNVEKPKPGPHADGVVGSVSSPTIESLDKQYEAEETKAATPSPQSTIFFVQYS